MVLIIQIVFKYEINNINMKFTPENMYSDGNMLIFSVISYVWILPNILM
jgi:hypothetical protein